jgi:hypothetical protein
MNVIANSNPWIETMKSYITQISGFDVLGANTLAFLSASWIPSTVATSGYFDLCYTYKLAPLATTPVHMAGYVTYPCQLGTVKA